MSWIDVATLAGLIVAVVPHLITLVRHLRKVRTIARYYDGRSNAYVVIHVAHPDPNRGGERRLVKHGTATAVREICEFLRSNGKTVSVRASHEALSKDDLAANLVLIGSDTPHQIPSVALDVQRFEFAHADGAYWLVDRDHGVRYESQVDSGGAADICLLLKAPNPSSPQAENRIIWVAGIHAIGCWGGAKFLTDLEQLKRSPRVKPTQSVATVLEATFSDVLTVTGIREYAHAEVTG